MNSDRIIKNTLVQSIKLIANIFIGLYATRLTIQFLGVENYGIFSVLGGVVTMLALLKSTLTNTSLRYLSYTSGYENKSVINQYFNSVLSLHLIVAAITLLLVEVVGYVCFNYGLINIPSANINEAKMAYHVLAMITVIAIVNAPIDALLFSKEDFLAIAIADISLSIIKVIGVLFFTYFIDVEHPIFIYTILIFSTEALIRLIKFIYSRNKYRDYHIEFCATKIQFVKEMLSFSLWNLLGTVTIILRRQANALIINNFVGVIANAANNLAKIVQTYINNFSINITKAITPQMMRGEGLGNRENTVRLTYISAKYSSLIFLLLFFPLYFELEFVLSVWLGKIPEYTVLFTKLSLIYCLIERFSSAINNALMAVGKIEKLKLYEFFIVAIITGCVILTYKVHSVPELVFYGAILTSIFNIFIRLYLGRKYVGFTVKEYIKNAVMPLLIPSLFAFSVGATICSYLESGVFRFFINVIAITITYIVSSFFFTITKDERIKLLNKIKKS